MKHFSHTAYSRSEEIRCHGGITKTKKALARYCMELDNFPTLWSCTLSACGSNLTVWQLIRVKKESISYNNTALHEEIDAELLFWVQNKGLEPRTNPLGLWNDLRKQRPQQPWINTTWADLPRLTWAKGPGTDQSLAETIKKTSKVPRKSKSEKAFSLQFLIQLHTGFASSALLKQKSKSS